MRNITGFTYRRAEGMRGARLDPFTIALADDVYASYETESSVLRLFNDRKLVGVIRDVQSFMDELAIQP